jgi:O-antigen ligase
VKILFVVPFILVLSNVMIVSDKFPNKTAIQYFWFYGVVATISIVIFFYSILEKKSYRVSLQDFFILLFCSICLIVTWFNNESLCNKQVILLLLFPLYFSFRYILQNNIKTRNLMLVFLLITGLLEALWGIFQLYGLSRSYNSLYSITGSFFNPGPYGGYLALVVPVALYFIFSDYRAYNKCNIRYLPFYLRSGLSTITLASIVIILPSTMSRAAWIATLIGCIYVIGEHYRRKRKSQEYLNKIKWLITGKRKYILFFIASILIIGVYYLKKDSADGRLLIWKVSIQIIKKHPFGVGLGNFAGSYGNQQAEYFASGKGTNQDKYVAGSPDYAFNEYIQICAEYGILGLLIFIAISVLAVYSGIKNRRYSIVGSLISLLVFAAMSYPFNVLPFIIVFVFLLASCESDIKSIDSKKSAGWYATVVGFGLLLAITIISSFSRIATYHAYNKWNTVEILKTGRLNERILQLCEEILSELNHEIRFVFYYANLLKENGLYAESNHVLQQGMKISCDPVLYNLSGINYQMMKNYIVAESYFKKAADMVPNRLLPYYMLANLYLEMGLCEQACEMAKIVQTKEPKVNSQAVEKMREEMKKICID